MALEKSAQGDIGLLCLIIIMILSCIVTIPIIGYYGYLISSGYTDYNDIKCQFLGVTPLTSTCYNSTVDWLCVTDYTHNFSYNYKSYTYNGPNVTEHNNTVCSQNCCDEFIAGNYYDCIFKINNFNCGPPTLPDHITNIFYGSIIWLSSWSYLGIIALSVCIYSCRQRSNHH